MSTASQSQATNIPEEFLHELRVEIPPTHDLDKSGVDLLYKKREALTANMTPKTYFFYLKSIRPKPDGKVINFLAQHNIKALDKYGLLSNTARRLRYYLHGNGEAAKPLFRVFDANDWPDVSPYGRNGPLTPEQIAQRPQPASYPGDRVLPITSAATRYLA